MEKTPVSKLQDLADKHNFQISYELLPLQNNETPRNIYQYKLKAKNIKVYGKEYSKQEAKKMAAIKALEQLTESDIQSHENNDDQEDTINIVGLLNKFVLENNLSPPKFELVSAIGEPHSKLFTIECSIGTFSFQGTDTTKRKAKSSAAKQMLELLSETTPDDVSFHTCKTTPNQEEMRDIYNERALMCKKKKTSCPTLVSSYPETIKVIMKEKDLSYDEVWSCYETADLDQLKYVLEKLDINMDVKFLEGKNNTSMVFISLDTKPDFTLVEWASTKKEALDAAVKQTIEFLQIMTK